MFYRMESRFHPSPDFSGVTNDIDLKRGTLIPQHKVSPKTHTKKCADVIKLHSCTANFGIFSNMFFDVAMILSDCVLTVLYQCREIRVEKTLGYHCIANT